MLVDNPALVGRVLDRPGHLMQAGQPGRQSALMTVNILINVGLNIWLIPIYGIQGAAMATACAFAVSGLTLNAAVWRWLPMPGGLLFGGR